MVRRGLRAGGALSVDDERKRYPIGGRMSDTVLGLGKRFRLKPLTERHNSVAILGLFAFVNGLVSMLSAREKLDATGYAAPVVPDVMPEGAAYDQMIARLRSNEIVKGKRGVTADTALRLAQLFKTTPQFWMHMQANFDLKAAMARRRAIKLAGRS